MINFGKGHWPFRGIRSTIEAATNPMRRPGILCATLNALLSADSDAVGRIGHA